MLPEFKLKNSDKLFFCTDIHEHPKQFKDLVRQINPSPGRYLICLGDVYGKGYGIQAANEIIDIIRELSNQGLAFMIRGNHELKTIINAQKARKMNDTLKWISNQPLAITFLFDNGSRVTGVHGGVLPKHKWSDLNHDVETSYVRVVDEEGNSVKMVWRVKNDYKFMELEKPGELWHNLYCGRFGYLMSGHNSQKDGIPKFYNYSANIDTSCYSTGVLTGLEYTANGRGAILTATGPAKRPDIKLIENKEKV